MEVKFTSAFNKDVAEIHDAKLTISIEISISNVKKTKTLRRNKEPEKT
jgi:hypothetical protein